MKNKLLFLMLSLPAFSLLSCENDNFVNLYDGESLIRSETVEIDKEYSFGTYEKTGYRFLGWFDQLENGIAYTDEKGNGVGKKWSEDYPTSLYAHCVPNDYLITFDYENATSQNSIKNLTVTYDQVINYNFPVPQKEGWSFAGWYTSKKDGIQITDSNGSILKDVEIYNVEHYPLDKDGTTLYALWVEKQITFNFVCDDNLSSLNKTVNDTIDELPTLIKDNYCFEGWYTDPTFINKIELPYLINENSPTDIFLYPKFIEGSNNVLQFTTISSDKEYSVKYSGNDTSIVIPDTYYGKKVTKIEKVYSESLENVLLPSTINEFSKGAFSECVNLNKINIPNKITKIPENAFYNCKMLPEINLSKYVTNIGKSAFYGCAKVENIYVGKNITTIEANAFGNMNSLKSIEVDVENTKYVSIQGVLYSKVGTSKYLIQYPSAKENEVYRIDPSTTKIYDNAFSNSSIRKIEIDGKISNIGKNAFESCENLINVTINTESTNLQINDNAFINCTKLQAFLIYSTNQPIISNNVFSNVSKSFSIYVSSDKINSYLSNSNWNVYKERIFPLSSIYGDFALEEVNDGFSIRQYFGKDENVVIPEIINTKKIIGISNNAFANTDINKITISKNITFINDNAFSNCINLNSIILECNVPILGKDVFLDVNDNFSIYIKNTASVLDEYKNAEGWSEFKDNIWSYFE